jgi:hypothetical protein
MANNLGKNVQVTWEDAWSNDRDYFTKESVLDEQPFIMEVVGRVIRDNTDGLTVARECLQDGRHRSIQHIPRAMVRKVKVLR